MPVQLLANVDIFQDLSRRVKNFVGGVFLPLRSVTEINQWNPVVKVLFLKASLKEEALKSVTEINPNTRIDSVALVGILERRLVRLNKNLFFVHSLL